MSSVYIIYTFAKAISYSCHHGRRQPDNLVMLCKFETMELPCYGLVLFHIHQKEKPPILSACVNKAYGHTELTLLVKIGNFKTRPFSKPGFHIQIINKTRGGIKGKIWKRSCWVGGKSRVFTHSRCSRSKYKAFINDFVTGFGL